MPAPKAFPELTEALRAMIDRIEDSLRESGYKGPPIQARLAGGMAINYWCGTRYTRDVDADFSKRFVLPKDLTVNYTQKSGTNAFIYFDYQYNTSLALLHENFDVDSVLHESLNRPSSKGPRLVEVRVLTPVDLAVSKLARFTENDRRDIYALAINKLITAESLRERAEEAMQNFIGDKKPLQTTIDIVCRDIEPNPDFEKITAELFKKGTNHFLVNEALAEKTNPPAVRHPLLISIEEAVEKKVPAAVEVKEALENLRAKLEETQKDRTPTKE